jgi:glycosyltransferase involved in cell wall biosynthesis
VAGVAGVSGGRAPTVSALMPVRDGQRHLRGAVCSMLAQTWQDLELIVVDDGSRDATPEILAGIDDDRLVVVRTEAHGVAAALNVGLGRARGPLVVRADADDLSHPTRVEVQVQWMRAHPEVSVLGTMARVLGPDGQLEGTIPVPVGWEAVAAALYRHNPLIHGTVMLRRSPLLAVGGYREVACEDYDLWARLHRTGHRLANLAEVLYDYRVHPQAVSTHRGAELLAAAAVVREDLWACGRPPAAHGRNELGGPHAALLRRSHVIGELRLAREEQRHGLLSAGGRRAWGALLELARSPACVLATPAPLRR